MSSLVPGRIFGLALRSASVGAVLLGCAAARAASITTVSFDDPGGAHAPYYQGITTDLRAADDAWARALGGHDTPGITIQVAFDPALPTMQGASVGARRVGQDARTGLALYEQGTAAKLKGTVPDGGGVDGRITIGEAYLASDLWFDPDPAAAATPVPAAKVDAYSEFLHEFGHLLAFNGWRDGRTGALGGAESTFDRWVEPRDGTLWLTGPRAVAVYGGPVPLTFDDYGHVGNGTGRPGQDLVSDLMNGVVWYRGTRYGISPLDEAIAADAGVADAPFVAVGLAAELPEPSSLAVLGAGLLAALRPRQRPRRASRRGASPGGNRGVAPA